MAADPIATALRAERRRQGLTLQQLGERLGRATYQTVWQWESGTHDPLLSNVRDWAPALGQELTIAGREQMRARLDRARSHVHRLGMHAGPMDNCGHHICAELRQSDHG